MGRRLLILSLLLAAFIPAWFVASRILKTPISIFFGGSVGILVVAILGAVLLNAMRD